MEQNNQFAKIAIVVWFIFVYKCIAPSNLTTKPTSIQWIFSPTPGLSNWRLRGFARR